MSSSTDDFGQVSSGLDRAEIGVSPPVGANSTIRPEVPEVTQSKPSIRHAIGGGFPGILAHPKDGLRRIKRVIKEKHEIGDHDVDETSTGHAPILAPEPPLGFGDERLTDEAPKEKSELPSLNDMLYHPISTAKSVARNQGGGEFAESLAKSEVTHSADVRLLRQDQAISDASPGDELDNERKIYQQHKHARQDAFVRWSIDRHTSRVAVIPTLEQPSPRPRTSAGFQAWTDYSSKTLVYQLETHGQDYVDLSPEWTKPTEALLSSACERVIVASSPFQSLIIQLRDVSQWKNPRQSAAWMTLYFVCLIYSQTTRMAILALLLSVIHRRWNPRRIDDMHAEIRATEDKEARADSLSILILKYGTEGWVDKLIEQAGPMLLRNVEQAAATLERVQNLYEWRDPFRTSVTLAKLMCIWVLLTFTPTWLLVQMLYAYMGIVFFILEPIGSRYPRYRLFMSPFTPLMWKIPTHAEWAIARLQAEASQQLLMLNASSGDNPETSDSSPRVIGKYNYEGDKSGRLVLTTRALTFSPDSSDEAESTIKFTELSSMHKTTDLTRTRTLKGLLFVSNSGEHHHLPGLERRNEVFSQILGYSGLPWKRIE